MQKDSQLRQKELWSLQNCTKNQKFCSSLFQSFSKITEGVSSDSKGLLNISRTQAQSFKTKIFTANSLLEMLVAADHEAIDQVIFFCGDCRHHLFQWTKIRCDKSIYDECRAFWFSSERTLSIIVDWRQAQNIQRKTFRSPLHWDGF